MKNSADKPIRVLHILETLDRAGIETFLMNLFLTGAFSTFGPSTYMDRSHITVIRPLVYAPEKEIRKFIKRENTFQRAKEQIEKIKEDLQNK